MKNSLVQLKMVYRFNIIFTNIHIGRNIKPSQYPRRAINKFDYKMVRELG